MQKKPFSTELAYVLGIVFVALGVAWMARADFGVSMVVAPAYVIYLKVNPILPFFTFGMAEYALQAVLLICMSAALRRFRLSYLFSFITAVVYGFTLDGIILLTDLIPGASIPLRLVFYILGMLFCAFGVSCMFHTYISPEVYELFVKEISGALHMEIHKFKTIYDCTSCLIGIILSFAFFGLFRFEGVKLGTVLCAFINGPIIGFFSKTMERKFEFRDTFQLRELFSK